MVPRAGDQVGLAVEDGPDELGYVARVELAISVHEDEYVGSLGDDQFQGLMEDGADAAGPVPVDDLGSGLFCDLGRSVR